MDEKTIKNILKTIGIPLGIIMFFLLLGMLFYLYRNYLEAKKLNLEIVILNREVNP